jgi:hypothetical protein
LALNDTALDLVSVHSVREVLDAIVRRARILLGADASYLTLVRRVDDVDGEQLVRVTSGIAHHDFRDVDAMGLGRLVLSTRNPQATADYFADNRFVHDRRVDAVARREGLRAVLDTGFRQTPIARVSDRCRRASSRHAACHGSGGARRLTYADAGTRKSGCSIAAAERAGSTRGRTASAELLATSPD